MEKIDFQTVSTNGINVRLATIGEGPLVIFCHGWPESWYSYRHQLPALAEEGFKAVAYDVRGYGKSDKPHPIKEYTMLNMVADVIGIIKALGYDNAITVGHDWGGPIALTTAALHPEIISATGTMSVPYMSRGPMPAIDLWKEIYKDRFFYQLYFQEEGVAESEFEADLQTSLRLCYINSDGRGMTRALEKRAGSFSPQKGPDSTFLEGMEDFDDLPDWLSQDDIDYFVSQFEISGMRGPLNRYRAQNIDWNELSHLPKTISQPAFFITGTLDPVNFFVPSEQSLIDRIGSNYDNLLVAEELEGVGHWTQQEAPEKVNKIILDFLRKLD